MKSSNSKRKWTPFRLTLVYGLIGILWMTLLNYCLNFYFKSSTTYLIFQNLKDLTFILITGIAIFCCIKYLFEKDVRIDQERSELLRRNLRLKAIADHLKSSLIILDPSDGKIIYTNNEFTRLTGFEFNEVEGNSFRMFLNEETHPFVVKSCEVAVLKQRATSVEFMCQKKDGSFFWNEWKLSPIFDHDNQLLFFIIIQNDITKRKNYETQLQESEQRYKSLFEHNPEIVCACDLEGFITRVNPAVHKTIGYSVDEVIGCNYRNFIDEKDWESVRKFFRKVLRGKPQIGQFQARDIDGNAIDLEAVVMPIVVDGAIEGMYTIAKDVTNYNKAQVLLRKAEKLNVVGELAAGIAHEIRNPLTSLKGFVQLLRPSLTEKKAYTDVMLSELERIEQIVTELLLLAKPQPVHFEEKNLQDLLGHVRTLLSTKAIMNNIEITMNYHCDTEKIFCEENQLKQVLINLVKNAIEAMPDGGEIRMEAVNPSKDKVCIRVIDQGCGIPEESLSKLGEPFYTTKAQGTGLGLMISSKIIREHGGKLVFKSKEGEGTTAEMMLPIAAGIEEEEEEESEYQLMY